jgi:hypothetical protein
MIGDGNGIGSFGGPEFAGKQFGGGGWGVIDLTGDFTTNMMRSSPNFTPNLYGLPTKDRKTGEPINYGTGFEGTVPGGYETSGYSIPEGYKEGIDQIFATGRKIDPMNTLSLNEALFNSSSFTDPSGITPTMPSFTEPATGIFGGTLGPKLKNSLPGRIITGALRINPGTRGLMMGISLLKGLKNAENPAEFLRQGFTRMALSRALGGKGLGLSSLQRQGLGSLVNMARGRQTLGQSIKSLGTSAAFRKAAPSLLKGLYKQGGMPAVYVGLSALQMAQRGIQQRIAKGPGGGG